MKVSLSEACLAIEHFTFALFPFINLLKLGGKYWAVR